jgi:hypothetical protein
MLGCLRKSRDDLREEDPQMADTPHSPDATGDDAVRRGRGPTAGTPRWVKVSGIIAAVVVLLVVIMLLAGGGGHGPSRHTGGLGGHTNHQPR